MADRSENLQSHSWLEAELARQLRPVSAPDALWSRIHEQRRPLRMRPHPIATWSVAAAALLMLLAGLVWRLSATRESEADLAVLARRELRGIANGAGNFDIRSGDAAEIHRWLKAKLDVDVAFAPPAAPGNETVRLLGAWLIRQGHSSVGVVAYRVGDDLAAMVVENRRPRVTRIAGSSHAVLLNAAAISRDDNARLYSWSLGENDYAIAFAGANGINAAKGAKPSVAPTADARPCLLCHVNAPALMVLK